MANTHNVGKFYWHTMVYPIKFKGFIDTAETQEIDTPYRGGKGYTLRLPFTKLAVVLGMWGESYPESIALTRAISGRVIKEEEFDWDTIRTEAEDVL